MNTRRISPQTPPSGKPLTGKKVLLIAIAFFGVIITANMTLLFFAAGSFPGLVVKNSYVASQGWDRRADAQRALGWVASAEYVDGVLLVVMTGPDGGPVTGLSMVAIAGRPASDRDDMRLELAETRQGYAAPLTLAPGIWRVLITAAGPSGNSFETNARLNVKTPADG